MCPWRRARPWTPHKTPLDNSGRPEGGRRTPEMETPTKRPGFPSSFLADTDQSGRIPDENNKSLSHCPTQNLEQNNRQKPNDAYDDTGERSPPRVLPTVPLPLGAMKPPSPEKAKKKKNKSLRAIVRFATTSLGKNITSHEVKKVKTKRKKLVMPPRPKLAEDLVRAHARPLQATALKHPRQSFELYQSRGWLKKPVIHVEFDMPGNCKECIECSKSDFLYVYVGLCNVFLLQFVIVVLLFFTDKEVDLSDLGAYYN